MGVTIQPDDFKRKMAEGMSALPLSQTLSDQILVHHFLPIISQYLNQYILHSITFYPYISKANVV